MLSWMIQQAPTLIQQLSYVFWDVIEPCILASVIAVGLKIVRQLKRQNEILERLVEVTEKRKS